MPPNPRGVDEFFDPPLGVEIKKQGSCTYIM
jgi:hypothetical protein